MDNLSHFWLSIGLVCLIDNGVGIAYLSRLHLLRPTTTSRQVKKVLGQIHFDSIEDVAIQLGLGRHHMR